MQRQRRLALGAEHCVRPKDSERQMRKDHLSLETVGPENLAKCGIGCLSSPENQGYQCKVDWLRKTFDDGVRLLMFRDDEGKALGFLECVPGEFAWRPARAAGWLFVHCLWV